MPSQAAGTDMTAVRRHVDEHRREFLDLWKRYVSQPSISAQGIGVGECADLLESMMVDAGIAVRRTATPGAPVFYGEIGPGPNRALDPARPTILFYGHYDVQPPDPLPEWISPPFEPTERDGKLYGRGTSDNKGQHLAHILAVRSLVRAAGGVPLNVKFLIEGEEEIGSPNLDRVAREHRDLLAADVVCTSDGPMHHSGRPLVFFGVRGVCTVELHCQAAKWDNHSGNKGGVVPNPAWQLVELLHTMRTPDGRCALPGFYDRVRRIASDEELIRRMPYDPADSARLFGVDRIDLDAATFYRRLLLEPTTNICGFTSGYGGKGMKTIIPAEALVKLDFRLVVDQDPDEVVELVRRHVARFLQERGGPPVEVRRSGAGMAPSRTPSDLPVCQAIVSAVAAGWGEQPVVAPNLGGSLPDAVFTRTLGLPSVGVPYANPDQANHSPNENMSIDCFFRGIATSAQVMADLARYSPGELRDGPA